jgi:serine/threonine protein kinase
MGELLGTVISDRYELTGILGHGGQGVVYRARDRTTGRGVAIKMLSDSVADDPVYAARLAREQEALVALAGTSAVAVYDLCEAPNGSLCLVMELLEGSDLEKRFEELEARNERLPLARLSSIMEPIVDTLERAHDAGIIHRDLKPGNIFLLSDGEGVRLFDFGLSRSRKAMRLTAAGTVMGSPSYIAPEVWKGDSDALDGRVDVYSLAVILFRALSGDLPFEGRTLKESFELASNAPRPSLRALRPDLPPRVDAWVAQALAIDRDRRFQTARGMWNGFLKALEYQPPPRPMRPVAESLIGAWKTATFAFRKLVDRATAAIPEARPKTAPPPTLMPPPEEVAAVDGGWIELDDDDIAPSSLRKPARTAPPPRRRRADATKPEASQAPAAPAAPAASHGTDADAPDSVLDRPSFHSTAENVRRYLSSMPPADEGAPAKPAAAETPPAEPEAATPAESQATAPAEPQPKAPAEPSASPKTGKGRKQKKARSERKSKRRGKGAKGRPAEPKTSGAKASPPSEKKPAGDRPSRQK